jgi:hypothetical protein
VIGDGSLLAINSLPLIDCNTIVKLSVDNVKAGSYQLRFKDVSSFTNGASISLKDKFANKAVTITEGTLYSFSISSNPASFGSSRFELQFLANQPVQDFMAVSQPACEQSNGLIQIANSQSNVAYVAMANNKAISSLIDGNGGSIGIVIDKEYLTSNLNTIAIYASSKSCASVFLKKDITMAVIGNPAVAVASASTCEPGSLRLKAYSAEAVRYNWFESETVLTSDLGQHDSVYVTPILSKSKTYYVSVVNVSGCESQRVAVEAKIESLPNVFIIQDGNVLKSSYETNNQWYFNNNPIFGSNNSTVALTEMGTYKLTVNDNGCSASAEYEYVITSAKSDYDFQVTAFPNPVVDVINIEVRGLQMQGGAAILNAQGQVIGNISLESVSEIKTGQFDMSNQSPGIYFIRAVSVGKVYNIKFIKED